MGDNSFYHGAATPVTILQLHDEFEQLLDLYRTCRPRRVVEIGTYYGGTLFHWLQNADSRATIVSVDSYTTGVDNRSDYSSWTPDGVSLVALHGDSHDPAVVHRVHEEVGAIDWLFIDGGHLDHEARRDYELYGPLVAPGGLIVFHDILNHPRHPELQVWRLWQEIRDTGSWHQEYTSDSSQEDCGIGVLCTRHLMNVITPLTRMEGVSALCESLAKGMANDFDVHWWIVLNNEAPYLPQELFSISGSDALRITVLHCPASGYDAEGRPAFGHAQRSFALNHITEGWVWTLDDDNLCQPGFGQRLMKLTREYPNAGAFILGQQRADGWYLNASPSNLGPGLIDTAQYVIRRDVVGEERVRQVTMDDGGFVQRVYNSAPDRFVFCDEPLTWHNWQLTPGAKYVTTSVAQLPGHLGGHQNITNTDEKTLDYLIERYCIRGMLDIGCGPGGMLDAALARGVSAVGIDGDPSMAENHPFVFVHDYTIRPLHWTPVDLVWCVEFVEHVEEAYVDNFLETFRSARVLFMSHAVPGQQGYHHVNEREASYWQAHLFKLGFRLEETDTAWVRKFAGNFYTRSTGMVFVAERELQ